MREEIESLTICRRSITSPEWEVCQRIQKIGSYNCILVPTFWLCPCTCPCIVSSFCCTMYTKHGTAHQKLDHYCNHKMVSKCLYWANCCQLMLNCWIYRYLNSLCDVHDNQNSTSKLWWNLSRWLSVLSWCSRIMSILAPFISSVVANLALFTYMWSNPKGLFSREKFNVFFQRKEICNVFAKQGSRSIFTLQIHFSVGEIKFHIIVLGMAWQSTWYWGYFKVD